MALEVAEVELSAGASCSETEGERGELQRHVAGLRARGAGPGADPRKALRYALLLDRAERLALQAIREQGPGQGMTVQRLFARMARRARSELGLPTNWADEPAAAQEAPVGADGEARDAAETGVPGLNAAHRAGHHDAAALWSQDGSCPADPGGPKAAGRTTVRGSLPHPKKKFFLVS